MKPRDVVLEQIDHRETRPVPYTLEFDEKVKPLLDDYYGDPSWDQVLTPYVLKIYPIDDLQWQPIDEVRCRDAYGGIWRMDRRPWHLRTPPLAEPSFEGYKFPKPEEWFDPESKKAALEQCQQHEDSLLLAYLGWGLMEASWGLRGFESVLMDCIAEPDFYEEMLDRLTEHMLAYVDYALDLPVDGVFFSDDWGHQRGVMIGPERWRKYMKPRWAKIYEVVHQEGKLIASHTCGSVAEIMPDIIEIGLDVLESVQPEAEGMNPYELKKKWGDKIVFWGGLGSQSTIPFGTPDEIKAEVRRLCDEMGRDGGYILAPAKPLQPGTPLENALAVVDAFTNQG